MSLRTRMSRGASIRVPCRQLVWLSVSACLAAGGWACRAGAPPCEVAHEPPENTPFSAQLHLHGSFSEGVGSISSHTHEAADVGVDVIWWSDHDWRIQAYRHVTRFDFEDWMEPIDRLESWTVRSEREAREIKKIGRATRHGVEDAVVEVSRDRAAAGSSSLHVEARGRGDGFGAVLAPLEVSRRRFPRSLAAGVTLHLSILPELVSADAFPVVRVGLSEHPVDDGSALASFALEYVLLPERPEPARQGTRYQIPLPWEPGVWNHYALPLTRDAALGFPELLPDDHSTSSIEFGVRARRGARGSSYFDSLRIDQRLRGAALLDRQRRMIEAAHARAPGIHQLQGVELSYWRPHLNAYGPGDLLHDYQALVESSGLLDESGWIRDRRALERFVAEALVDAAHERGQLVSYNHLFGAQAPSKARPIRSRSRVLRELVENRLHGADLLEVGYRRRGGQDLEDHLWVWDELAKRGLHPVGTGVSDSHGGPRGRWRDSPNNFVSWIYADSRQEGDLLAGLGAGRVFFGDLVRFRGTLDLVDADGFRMGRIIETERDSGCVSIQATGVPRAHTLRIVEDGRETARHRVETDEFAIAHLVPLQGRQTASIRVEIRDPGGEAIALSNPLVFTRRSSEATPIVRRAVAPRE